ncbi:hypothetical protein PIB30_081091 [Stylosanthes scabra]|uniref:Uncharacterized protein n=1 Tax=Stylosanthes scabra TaxID=79078 RepID=A0ABU6RSE0_9FABA|nr:hypothetical protein [Stylosanthes scabra]
MTSNFNSKFASKEGKWLLMNAAYSTSKKCYEFLMDRLGRRSPQYVQWVARFSLEIWTQHWDAGCRWGQMTTDDLSCRSLRATDGRNRVNFDPLTLRPCQQHGDLNDIDSIRCKLHYW